MTTKKFSDFLEESPVLSPHQIRRKILLPYKPNSSSSLELYQWASTNYFQSSLDHVYFVSVINIPRVRYPAPDNVWSFQNNVSTNVDYEKNLQHIKNEENAVKNGLEDIVNELRSKNITSSLIIKRGNTNKELLSACKSIKPDVILMSHSNNDDHQRRKLTKLFKIFDRSIVNLMKKKFPNIPIVINNEDDDNQDNSKSCSCSKFCSSNTEKGERIHKCKICDNQTSKKDFHRVFKKVKRKISLKSSTEDSKHYHQLSEG
ncbi:6162_t:CDS:2 [Dentiscutata erythropus]|uniref:6162_t:CDS:1 n=1 Tax=Dentiscutata erythropus TaxID=1348616 RepID=A0A9N9N5M4_9GLOM|nr:6162_t:CDS:2 [Dentiscutata erythropus]